jgi:hypothetical protein
VRCPIAARSGATDVGGTAETLRMKRRYRCKTEKTLAEFNRNSRNTDGLHSYCRECQKAHYRANKARHYSNVRRTKLERLRRDRALIATVLRGGCVDCGFSDIRALDFDHVRGEKVAGIATLVKLGRSAEVIADEIAKCEVRCRNCHAIATSERRARDWYADYV